jgi:hypothetical protein
MYSRTRSWAEQGSASVPRIQSLESGASGGDSVASQPSTRRRRSTRWEIAPAARVRFDSAVRGGGEDDVSCGREVRSSGLSNDLKHQACDDHNEAMTRANPHESLLPHPPSRASE